MVNKIICKQKLVAKVWTCVAKVRRIMIWSQKSGHGALSRLSRLNVQSYASKLWYVQTSATLVQLFATWVQIIQTLHPDFPDSNFQLDYAFCVWIRNRCDTLRDFMSRLSILKLLARLFYAGLDPDAVRHTARLYNQIFRTETLRATFATKAEMSKLKKTAPRGRGGYGDMARLSRPERRWRDQETNPRDQSGRARLSRPRQRRQKITRVTPSPSRCRKKD